MQGGEAAHRPGQEGLHQAAGRLRDVKQAIGNHEQVPAQETIHISISKITKEGGSVGAPHPRTVFLTFKFQINKILIQKVSVSTLVVYQNKTNTHSQVLKKGITIPS